MFRAGAVTATIPHSSKPSTLQAIFMKVQLLIAFFIICFGNSKGQAKLDKDSLVTQICLVFRNDQAIEPDSLKVLRILGGQLGPYLQRIS